MGEKGFAIMPHSEPKGFKERRKAPRFNASAIPNLKIINQFGGSGIKLINISRGGALIEGSERMHPGSRISLQLFMAKSVYPLKGRINRCGPSSTNNKVFQSAIEFDEEFMLLPVSTDSE